MDLLSVFINFAAVTNIPTSPATPTNPLPIPSQSRDASIFIAPASITTAAVSPIICTDCAIDARLDTIPDNGFVDSLSSLLRTAIALVNSINNVPTLSRDAPSLSESIVAITNSAAARTPTAPAILSKVSACKFF